MTYAALEIMLNAKYGSRWAVGFFSEEEEVEDGSVTLNFISDAPTIADDKIYKMRPSYQLSHFSTNPMNDADDFFISNNIPYQLKTKVYSDKDKCYQTTYTFFL